MPTEATASALLEAVNAAILKIVSNPASFVSIDGRQYSYQDLDKLRKMRTELRQEVSDEASASGTVGAGFRPLASGFSINPGDF